MDSRTNPPHSLMNQVMDEIKHVILILEKENAEVISPVLVEQRVMKKLDPEIKAPLLVSHLSRLQLRQLCRHLLIVRNKEHDENATRQILMNASIFDVQLQPYYPAKREGDEVYVLRAFLTLEERRYNESRLKAEARAKSLHADALKAETDSLFPAARMIAA